MKANVWYGREQLRVENVPEPKILNPRDAIVRITSTAICGSDLHIYDGYIPGMLPGDILVEIAGTAVSRLANLARALGPESIGQKITLRLIRAGAVLTLEATVAAQP